MQARKLYYGDEAIHRESLRRNFLLKSVGLYSMKNQRQGMDPVIYWINQVTRS